MMASSKKKYENLSSGSCYDCLDVVLQLSYLMGKSFLRFVRNCKTDIEFRKDFVNNRGVQPVTL